MYFKFSITTKFKSGLFVTDEIFIPLPYVIS